MGFFASVGQGWRFIKAAFAMGFKERSLFKPSVYLVLSSIVYFVAAVMVAIVLEVDFEQTGGKLYGAGITFGSFLIFYFFCGMTVNMIDVHIKGGKPSVSEGFKDASKNFLAICFLALISTVVEMFAKMTRRRGREGGGAAIILAIIGGIVEWIWTVVSFLLLPAIIIEDLSLGAALRRVRDLHKRNTLLIGIGEVGVRFVTGLFGILMVFAVFGVIWLSIKLFGDGNVGVCVAIVSGGTLLSLFAAFNTFVRMAYYTCLYLWAVEVERVGQNAPAPLPLAIALSRSPRHHAPASDASY